MRGWDFFKSLFLAALLAVALMPAARAAQHALVVYDGKTGPAGDAYLSARYVANLLGHFQIDAELRPLERYRRGELNRYDFVFFAPIAARPVFPAGFLDELGARQRPTVWLGRYIDMFLAGPRSAQLGLAYVDYLDRDEFRTVIYKNLQIPKGDPDLNVLKVLDGQKVRVYASARSEEGKIAPYALQSGNFWYFADCPFSYANEGDRYVVFCDLLHDILGQPHAAFRQAMVRIEDVSVDDDPQDLRAVADYLASEHVPFQIALIPIFRDPERGLEIRLSDRRTFVDAIRYMVAHGGSVVMHGVTHQYRGMSGDDFEFWNGPADKPIPNDGDQKALDRKLQLAFSECFANGIYPISWETPHNAGSEKTYDLLKKYFSVFHERELVSSAIGTEQYFPYVLRDVFGRFVVPENLGYVPVESPGNGPIKPATIVDHARTMLAVRDGIATFYFHPFMPLAYLKEMVRGIRELGFQYVSLRDFAPQVRFGQWQINVADAGGRVKLQPGVIAKPYVHRVVIDPNGGTTEETGRTPLETNREVQVARGSVVAWEPRDNASVAATPSLLVRARNWLAGVVRPTTAPARNGDFPRAAILWDPSARKAALRDQQAIEKLARTYGVAVERAPFLVSSLKPLQAIGADELVVVPAELGPQLSPEQQTRILDHVRAGGKLLLAGRSALAQRLGLEFADHTIQVSRLTDEYSEQMLRWQPAATVERFEPPEEAVSLMVDPDSRQVLAFWGAYGRGRYVYLAAPVDETESAGISRYPYLANHLYDAFEAQPRLTRPALEIYFDPGYRPSVDLARLAASWRKRGVRKVHVAAWYFSGRWVFPYRVFIDQCHRAGIAVYAWFEFPMMDKGFWEQHPEWREKSASGTDQLDPSRGTGTVGWRFLVNLRNPDAQKAALAFFREKVNDFDWDGINLAELNFDTSEPVMDPKKYVPMNDDVRREFAAAHSFDPALLFDQRSSYYWERNPAALKTFTDYRVQLVTDMHRMFLDELRQIPRAREMETVVTMLDSLHSTRLRASIGVDSAQIVRLMDKYPFTLQVEDPAEFWAASPDRYLQFGRTYLGLVRDPSRLMFDVNVVPDRNIAPTSLPSATATGAEFARLLSSASAASGRAAVYAESTVHPEDWDLAASVLAAGARATRRNDGWLVETPFAVVLRIAPGHGTVYLDGRAWPVQEENATLVPAGTHLLTFARPYSSFLDFEQLDLRLRSISGELLSADATRRGMDFSYSSHGRCLAVFNKQPYRVLVDGKDWNPASLFARGEWSLALPAGRHFVEVIATEPAVFAVEAASLVFSSAIVVFGLLGCSTMMALYILIRFRRTASARRRSTRPAPEVTS